MNIEKNSTVSDKIIDALQELVSDEDYIPNAFTLYYRKPGNYFYVSMPQVESASDNSKAVKSCAIGISNKWLQGDDRLSISTADLLMI